MIMDLTLSSPGRHYMYLSLSNNRSVSELQTPFTTWLGFGISLVIGVQLTPEIYSSETHGFTKKTRLIDAAESHSPVLNFYIRLVYRTNLCVGV